MANRRIEVHQYIYKLSDLHHESVQVFCRPTLGQYSTGANNFGSRLLRAEIWFLMSNRTISQIGIKEAFIRNAYLFG